MSRSFRHKPFVAVCGASSQKQCKRVCNRIMRRVGRVELSSCGEEAVFLRHDEALNSTIWRKTGLAGTARSTRVVLG